MLSKEFLLKIGFLPEEADTIIRYKEKYAETLAPLALEYMSGEKFPPLVPYAGDEREKSRHRAEEFVKNAREKFPDENGYVINLIVWLLCVPSLHERYRELGISDDVFFEGMKDFSYKARECKTVHGVLGLFTNWFFLFFDMKEVALGRLQYEVSEFEYDEYTFEDVKLRRGDMVYSCHIPSSGKLTPELCMESFGMAYEFFKVKLSGDILPITCHSWLLYPPYVEEVFPENSNMQKFAGMFDITDSNEDKDFYDIWRVFGKPYEGTTVGLPEDNTLRRNFIRYIKSGGDFGEGYGVILYDGKKKEIINRK